MPRQVLDASLKQVDGHPSLLKYPWGSIAGPFTTLWASLHRGGVRARSLDLWSFPEGRVLNISEACPYVVEQHVVRAVYLWQCAKIAEH
eukprot:8297238-Pyramimonas_sp.AAC.1